MVAFHLSLTREMREKLSTSKCYGVADVMMGVLKRYVEKYVTGGTKTLRDMI